MCYIELEACAFWSEVERRARKAHLCSCCGGPIRSGERYLVHFSVNDGEPTSEKMCLACTTDRGEFADEHESMTPTPSYFLTLLEECIVGDGEDGEGARWQPMLGAMKARKIAA